MTHRERVLAALALREPDRVPMDLGTARFTGMVKGACENLCRHLGFGRPGPAEAQMPAEVFAGALDHSGEARGAEVHRNAVRLTECQGCEDTFAVGHRSPSFCRYCMTPKRGQPDLLHFFRLQKWTRSG